MALDLNICIAKDLPAIVPDAVSFETGASKAQINDPNNLAYEHHGEGFSSYDRGALPSFYEDLLLGRAMPLTLATKALQDIDTLTAIALWLHRDLSTHPGTASFIYTVDFVHRLGFPALAHIEENLARFFTVLRNYFPEKGISQREFSERLTTAVGWIREYIHNGAFPTLGPAPNSNIRVLDLGSTGFVLAETKWNLWDGWAELYRQGFLRGAIVHVGKEDRRQVLIARKSLYVPFNLSMASRILNQMETAMGELPEWKESKDGLWLEGPQEGTLILLQHLIEVLVRI